MNYEAEIEKLKTENDILSKKIKELSEFSIYNDIRLTNLGEEFHTFEKITAVKVEKATGRRWF